jgi:hypothetical protein
MINYQNKTFIKLAFFALAQIFLLTGAVYPGSSSNKAISSIYIHDRALRIPLDSSSGYSRMLETADRITSPGKIYEQDKVVAFEDGKFLLKKAVKLGSLSPEDRQKFGKALFKMSQHAVSHKLTLITYAGSILQNQNFGLTEIYAAIDETGDEWNISALQIVNFKDEKKKDPVLSTWIKSDEKVDFVANQILAFAINDLLNNGVEKVDSSRVAYTDRVRMNLPSGINNVSEMKNFLLENAKGVSIALNRAGKDLENLQEDLKDARPSTLEDGLPSRAAMSGI